MLQLPFQNTSTTTSAHLAQTMTLLGLTSTELEQKIESELANNPALELLEERRCPMCKRLLPSKGPCPICSQPSQYDSEAPIVFISPREDFYNASTSNNSEPSEDLFSFEPVDLPTFVLRQIAADLDNEDKIIAAYILTHLDDDGFLTIEPFEIARYYHRPINEIVGLIKKLQRCEPIGVCAANPQEAMMTQLDILSEIQPIPAITKTLLEQGMDELSHHHYADLAQKFNVKTREIEKAVHFISENLNPFPGRSHWGDMRESAEIASLQYHRPDVMIYHMNENPSNPLVVEIITPVRGSLRVNPLFKKALSDTDNEKIGEWKQDIEKASLLIKCIQQRNNALKLLLEKLVVRQRGFIISDEKSMLSITRAELAKELEFHESTISRAVSGKTVQLPNKKIVPMAIFFDRSLAQRHILKEIIDAEDLPLTDTDLQKILADQGINIARRTVAKYRTMEGILPAHLRHNHFSS